jgi:hypothetical protein
VPRPRDDVRQPDVDPDDSGPGDDPGGYDPDDFDPAAVDNATLRRKSRGGQRIGAAMIGLAEVLQPKPKVEVPIEIATPGEPPNIDTDGLDEMIGPSGERMVGPPMDTIKAKAKRTHVTKRRR